MILNPKAVADAQKHARAEYPKESCGVVIQGKYMPVANVAADPLTNFEMPAEIWAKAKGGIEMVIHSHPDGPLFPSQADMEGQIGSNVPWAIIPLDEERMGDPIMWGDGLPVTPILGREFRHGVTDCYSTIRDVFRLGRDKLAEQGITGWPYESIVLPEVPRADNWWTGEDDLYSAHFEKFGFRKIDMSQARGGDVFLVKIKSEKFNHGGVLLEGGILIHHLVGRLSRREPAGIWGRAAGLWIRYQGDGHAA